MLLSRKKTETQKIEPQKGEQPQKLPETGPAAPEKPELSPEKAKAQAELQAALKEIESAMYAVKFYPVAVTELSKDEALAKLERIYSSGNETVRQMLLYMIHETLCTSADLKIMHTFDYFKAKYQNQEPSQLRVHVYRAMFNYNNSLEGLTELMRLLGRMRGNDDAAKLLTYHFSHLSAVENEGVQILRSAILEALGDSESRYALSALLDYARYTNSERTFNRVVEALTAWEGKVGSLKLPEAEKAKIMERIREIITSDFGGSHYG